MIQIRILIYGFSWSETLEESPPLSSYPQVTTDPSFFNAAKAKLVEKI